MRSGAINLRLSWWGEGEQLDQEFLSQLLSWRGWNLNCIRIIANARYLAVTILEWVLRSNVAQQQVRVRLLLSPLAFRQQQLPTSNGLWTPACVPMPDTWIQYGVGKSGTECQSTGGSGFNMSWMLSAPPGILMYTIKVVQSILLNDHSGCQGYIFKRSPPFLTGLVLFKFAGHLANALWSNCTICQPPFLAAWSATVSMLGNAPHLRTRGSQPNLKTDPETNKRILPWETKTSQELRNCPMGKERLYWKSAFYRKKGFIERKALL